MKFIERVLDDYYTNKVLYKIKNMLLIYYINVTTKEIRSKKNRFISIYINRKGRSELVEPRFITRINKAESIYLLFDQNFINELKNIVEIELEMVSKGL